MNKKLHPAPCSLHPTPYTLYPAPCSLHPTPYTLFPILCIVLFFITLQAYADAATIVSTKHNLSTSGPGPIKATVETQICVFCHTPHGAITSIDNINLPLWNHSLSSASYIMPSSVTMKSIPRNPPDGDSRLCLSCHDGAVAIGSVVNLGGAATTISMQDAGTGYLTLEGKLSSAAPGFMGTDLSGNHPVSIEVNDALIADKNTQCINHEISWRVCNPLATPGQTVRLRPTSNLYGAGPHTNIGVQCSSCHDPHNDTPLGNRFLRAGTPGNTGPLCTTCHLDCSSACP